MFDFDLAQLYEVETKDINQAVKCHIKRLPKDFMFRLTVTEWQSVRSQFVTAFPNKPDTGDIPFAFTELGVVMLSGILDSDKAINMSIAIMRAFVETSRIVLPQEGLLEQLQAMGQRLSAHNTQLNSIYDAIENLLDEKSAQKKWDKRERIGFRK